MTPHLYLKRHRKKPNRFTQKMRYNRKNPYFLYGRNCLNGLNHVCIPLLSFYFAALYTFSGQRSSTLMPIASAIALRSRFDFVLPVMTWYTATRLTPIRRPISAPDMFLLMNSILIFCFVVIM